ncbi:hypothetical protein QF031_000957 [Pseudarthrobacter defluvii]|uniref:hypothetical protein n=1 Tax=Pseudarthrobacter defluvii TaxID=410837 RepID=UPI002784FECC|nr:hypothetical protein [Pseudarthrobacter defluvii]MDQ0768208.1 hypothetical protein [Pseudarthrobacter defluvii]
MAPAVHLSSQTECYDSELAELVLSGGGLKGASAKQVRAILEKLQTLAVVIEHRSLPSAQFSDATDEPCVFYFRAEGRENSAALFFESHLSASP